MQIFSFLWYGIIRIFLDLPSNKLLPSLQETNQLNK